MIKSLKSRMREGKKPDKVPSKGLSTGSTLLNLACSGNPSFGFPKGHYYFIVGDTNSGKSWLSLTCLAEASINRSFKNYRFIFDNAEDGALMDIERFFGKDVFRRMEPPAVDQNGPVYSSTVEEFYFHVDDALKKGEPFIYILDSMDALSSEAEKSKFDENKTAYQKGREQGGSYGDAKAKLNSSNLRRLLGPLKKTGSILIIINQTRDNIGFSAKFNPKTRSGGHALGFYASIEMWSSVRERIKKTIRGKPRHVGTLCKVHVKRSRITGRERTVELPIYFSTGMDDLGSCVDYLVEEGHWKENKGIIDATEFRFKGDREKLIARIESDNADNQLKEIVAGVWKSIEEACEVKRKSKYHV